MSGVPPIGTSYPVHCMIVPSSQVLSRLHTPFVHDADVPAGVPQSVTVVVPVLVPSLVPPKACPPTVTLSRRVRAAAPEDSARTARARVAKASGPRGMGMHARQGEGLESERGIVLWMVGNLYWVEGFLQAREMS